MNIKNCTVRFFLKPTAKSEYPIYGRIVYNRKKAEFFTGESINPKKWYPDAGMPIRDSRLKEYLNSLENKILARKRENNYKMENESMKMTLGIIHSAPVKYITFTICLITGVLVLKKVLSDLVDSKECPTVQRE